MRLIYYLRERSIRWSTTSCSKPHKPNRGGIRWWFLCPLVRNGRPCGRRVQKLYLPPHARQFGCRHCYNLTYDSRRRDAGRRAIWKAIKLRERLGGREYLDEEFPERPPRMWRRMYERLRKEGEEAEAKYRRLAEVGAFALRHARRRGLHAGIAAPACTFGVVGRAQEAAGGEWVRVARGAPRIATLYGRPAGLTHSTALQLRRAGPHAGISATADSFSAGGYA